MRFSTTFVALVTAAPALAAPVRYSGNHNQERDLEELEVRSPRHGGAAKALGHFAGAAASHLANNSKRSPYHGGSSAGSHGGHGNHGGQHQNVSERDIEAIEARQSNAYHQWRADRNTAKATQQYKLRDKASKNHNQAVHSTAKSEYQNQYFTHNSAAQRYENKAAQHLSKIHRRSDELSERDLGELVEEIDARSFDEPVDIDLMIRELGSSEEDSLYF
jgi:hypothetical protein